MPLVETGRGAGTAAAPGFRDYRKRKVCGSAAGS